MNEVVIEKLVVGGLGLARRPDGMVVLIPQVIPGEVVRFEPLKSKKSFQAGLLLEVLTPSPDRVPPPCPYFGRCGGCHFQHIAVSRQDALKKQIFYDEFCRSGLHFAEEAIRYLSSPLALGYRQRIRLHVREGRLGFFQPQSHSLLAIDQCLLARPEINAVLRLLAENSHWRGVAAHLDEVEIQVNPANGRCLLFCRFLRKPRPRDLTDLQHLLDDLDGLAAVLVKTADGALSATLPAAGEPMGYVIQLAGAEELTVSLEPGGFCQVNEGQNQQMVDQVLAWLRDQPRGRVLDLFCGVGNFSLPLARLGFQVTGIDQQRAAIRSALHNGERNQLSVDFRRDAAQSALARLKEAGDTFDVVVLDPPRAGFKEGSALLPGLGAEKIIYISCDQATLFRDLQAICAGGYQIAAITLVDQFCQSYHLECMVLLSRVSPALHSPVAC